MIANTISILINFLPLLIAIILHEIAHGYAAYRLGDSTAKAHGRLSLNPLKHIDVFGTILLPAMLIFSGVGFVFGWAKPVPVNFNNLHHYRRDMIIVSAAGIVTNIILAVLSALLLILAEYIPEGFMQGLLSVFLINMVVYNIILAVFNLLPIPPLDGSKIFLGWINKRWAQKYISAERQGLLAIIFIAFILPLIGRQFGWNFNLFAAYMIKVSKFFISLLI